MQKKSTTEVTCRLSPGLITHTDATDMTILFRIQEHVALTQIETRTLATLLVLLVGGLAAQRIPVSPPDTSLVQSTRAERFAALADSLGSVDVGEIAEPQVEVAAAEPAPQRATRARKADSGPVYVNLNTASQAELERLPRVGPKTAERILALRAEIGQFSEPDQLTRVKGIGVKTMDRLRPLVHVGS